MIIECPLNELFHDFVIVILLSQMVVSQIFLTVAVSWNVGTFIIFFITVLKNNEQKSVINGRPLFSLRNNGPKSSGC